MIKRCAKTKRSRSGMAMLMVLFIVMAIAVISAGFIARSDKTLACGRNFCVRTESDYAAWGGLEVAWALVQDPNTLAAMTFPVTDQLDTNSDIYYELTIGSAVGGVHAVTSRGFKRVNGKDRAGSTLYGDLFYDADSGSGRYLSIRREQ